MQQRQQTLLVFWKERLNRSGLATGLEGVSLRPADAAFDAQLLTVWYGIRSLPTPDPKLGCHFIDLTISSSGRRSPLSCVLRGHSPEGQSSPAPTTAKPPGSIPKASCAFSTNIGNFQRQRDENLRRPRDARSEQHAEAHLSSACHQAQPAAPKRYADRADET